MNQYNLAIINLRAHSVLKSWSWKQMWKDILEPIQEKNLMHANFALIEAVRKELYSTTSNTFMEIFPIEKKEFFCVKKINICFRTLSINWKRAYFANKLSWLSCRMNQYNLAIVNMRVHIVIKSWRWKQMWKDILEHIQEKNLLHANFAPIDVFKKFNLLDIW